MLWPGREDEEPPDKRSGEQQHAGEDIGEVPAEVRGGDELCGERAQDQRTAAVAHEQDAGGKALFVRESRDDGGDDAVVDEADAYPRDGEGDEEQPDALGREEHTEQKAHEAEHAARRDGKAYAEAVGDGPADDPAEAETAEHDGEADAQLRAGPAEALAEWDRVDAPGVDDAVYEHHGGADG